MTRDLTTPPSRCAICDTDRLVHAYDKPPAAYWRCTACGFIFQHPLPSPEAFVSYAETEYQGGLYSDYVRAREMKLEHFRQRLAQVGPDPRPGRLLDIGCSCGYFMEVAQASGYAVQGLEFSKSAIAAAADSVRPHIECAHVEELANAGGERFDLITAFDIIEHLTDPMALLCQARRLLAPKARLVISTPDAGHWLRPIMGSRWPMLQPMQHVSLFSGPALKLALERAGYCQITVGPAYKVLSWDYLIGQLRTLNPVVHSMAGLGAKALPTSVATRWRAVNIGEILAIATATP
jgi:SAM-dependent methyltransferase